MCALCGKREATQVKLLSSLATVAGIILKPTLVCDICLDLYERQLLMTGDLPTE